tara:strand:- start:284 stop:1042 length:759 start_codon:yes stop_codon:yes gene_type:complete
MEALDDLTIIISAFVDSEKRKDNIRRCVEYLTHHFDVDILICEQDTESKLSDIPGTQHVFIHQPEMFRKQISYNVGAKHAKTKAIGLYDADIILHPKQISKSAQLICDDKFDIVYPYDGKFYDVPEKYHEDITKSKSVSCIDIEECTLFNPNSIGGAVFYNRNVFLEGGGGNENFIGVGYEDDELAHRFPKLGYTVARIDQPLFHLTHPRKETSWNHNPETQHNQEEYSRIVSMPVEQLREEIKTWPGYVKN